jgi:hypothetical protein
MGVAIGFEGVTDERLERNGRCPFHIGSGPVQQFTLAVNVDRGAGSRSDVVEGNSFTVETAVLVVKRTHILVNGNR